MSFWAKKDAETALGNIYEKVNNEGEDFSTINKEGAIVIKKHLFSRSLIVKEEPAHIERKYGTMKVGKLPPPPVTPEVTNKRTSLGRRPVCITPKRPKLRR